MYTDPALFNPYLLSCYISGKYCGKTASSPWRTVKWHELEYVLTGSGGGFFKSCEAIDLRIDKSFFGFQPIVGKFTFFALHINNICNFDIFTSVKMFFRCTEEDEEEHISVETNLISDAGASYFSQTPDQLKLPAGFSGWAVMRFSEDSLGMQAYRLELGLLKPDERTGTALLLDRMFYSDKAGFSEPRSFQENINFPANISDDNISRLLCSTREGVNAWLRSGKSEAANSTGGWNGLSLMVTYAPRFQLARPGMVFFHRPGQVIRRVTGYTGIKLVFDDIYDAGLTEEYNRPIFEDASDGHLRALFRRKLYFHHLEHLPAVIQSCEREQDAFYKIFHEFMSCSEQFLCSRADLTKLIVRLAEAEDMQGFAYRIKAYLERNYDKDISLNELAQMEGITPEHLCRVFKRTYGISPVSYLVKVRLSHVRRLLLSTDLSAEEIIVRCGFASTSYFYSAFKKSFKMSPGEFRDHFMEQA